MIMEENKKFKIAAVADIHVKSTDKGVWTDYFKEVSKKANVLIIAGDLTNTGDEAEAEVLHEELKVCSIPVIAVMGNHDHEKGRYKLIRQILQGEYVHVLDGESIVIENIGFAGIKGFGGGFDNHMLSMFGEEALKKFVEEGVNEALKLDRALTHIEKSNENMKKIAVIHYSPVKATIVGEPEPIYPFLGCSRLAEPLSRNNVVAVFHGHAHRGNLAGETQGGVKVFNVSRPVLLKAGYASPFFIYEV
jgi:Icc-related predicted phosphoesterase